MQECKTYKSRATRLNYPIGDLHGYPDSLIRARTSAAYKFGIGFVNNNPETVMDFGSGAGHGVARIKQTLRPQRILSLEQYRPYLEAQSASIPSDNLTQIHFYNTSNISADLIGKKSVDAIFFMHVIEHIKNPLAMLIKMREALKADGQLVIATPDRVNIVGQNPHDEHVFEGNELNELLSKAGFQSDIFQIVADEPAWKVHRRKRWLAKHLPITGKLRYQIPWEIWDSLVLRLGIQRAPLSADNFSLLPIAHPKGIDLLVVCS